MHVMHITNNWEVIQAWLRFSAGCIAARLGIWIIWRRDLRAWLWGWLPLAGCYLIISAFNDLWVAGFPGGWMGMVAGLAVISVCISGLYRSIKLLCRCFPKQMQDVLERLEQNVQENEAFWR